MKLWDKGYTVNNLVDKFTVGNDRIYDIKLAKYDVQGSMAHAKMLNKIGLLTNAELSGIEQVLNQILHSIENNEFVIESNFEDIHSKIEYVLIEKLGDTGKKIHTARSRNDQILVDLHLYAKAEITAIKNKIKTLFDTLINLAEQHKNVLMPGYTHLQVAMPSSFGLWFSAYAESLTDDLIMLNAAYQIADQNPLGSAAGYGSSFPIDREMTTKLLGFSTLKYNSVAAQMSRGKLEKVIAYALSAVAATLTKMSADIILFMNQNFGFVSFPKELTTGSSIMPHKQNPDVFELVRARSNKVQALPLEIGMLTNNLTSGYHRDFQELKERFIDAIETTRDNIDVSTFMLQNISVTNNIVDDEKYDLLFSVEKVNELVLRGLSFRDAYKKIGHDILNNQFTPNRNINHTHVGSIGNLGLDKIEAKFEQVFAAL